MSPAPINCLTTIISKYIVLPGVSIAYGFFLSTKAVEACAHEIRMQTVNNTENTIEIAAKNRINNHLCIMQSRINDRRNN